MTNKEIKECFDRVGYVVVKDIITETELEPIRTFIGTKVDEYGSNQHTEGKLASLCESK